MRRCYICGLERSRRIIVEPLMLPICLERACAQRAAALPMLHCSARAPDGRLCGAPAAAQVQAREQRLCAAHLRAEWDYGVQVA
ncbi:MAG: hypothetical protein LC797_01740 [Chloroflexi bacterium]|nr:hypothetical protein [Chloroflexota bacterium]